MSISSKIAPKVIQSHTSINLARVEYLSPYDFAKCQIRGWRMDGWRAYTNVIITVSKYSTANGLWSGVMARPYMIWINHVLGNSE